MKDKIAAREQAFLPVLRNLILESQGAYLPSISAIARLHHIDMRVVSFACHALRKEGLLSYSHGTRMHIVGRPLFPTIDSIELWPSEPARTRIYSRLKSDIISGKIRTGAFLPKQLFFAWEFKVSTNTVRRVYRQLEADGLVHKNGLAWVIGQSPLIARTRSEREIPAILLVELQPAAWSKLTSERTAKLVATFAAELEHHHYLLIPSSLAPTDYYSGPAGIESIVKYAVNLGARYLGAVVAGLNESPLLFDETMERLCALGRPAVWIDTKFGGVSHSESKKWLCAHFSERRIAQTAVSFLSEMGHTTVGYIGKDDDDWQQRRKELLIEAARSAGHCLHVLTYENAVAPLLRLPMSDLIAKLRSLHLQGAVRERKVLTYLLQQVTPKGELRENSYATVARILMALPSIAPGSKGLNYSISRFGPLVPPSCNAGFMVDLETILPFLLCTGVTAIVCTRDQRARSVLTKCSEIGIAVPDDISVISFDNYSRFSMLPVTTIDIGADNLGYRVFHALAGDVPVQADRKGRIIAEPRVVRRGSVKRITPER